MSSISLCFLNEDLLRCILSYLPSHALLSIGIVCGSFDALSSKLLRDRYEQEHVKYLCYKVSAQYQNFKQAVCFIESRKNAKEDRILLIGTGFGAPMKRSVTLTLTPSDIRHRPFKSLKAEHAGCAISMDQRGMIHVIAGYSEEDVDSSSYVWSTGKVNGVYATERSFCLPQKLCFAAATSTIEGDLVISGGCSNPFQGAEVYSQCQYLKCSEESGDISIADLLHPRCGHQMVTLFDGSLMAMGGYRGVDPISNSNIYQTSSERWDWERGCWMDTGAAMAQPRSGFASCVGPGGTIYVAGGSIDGSFGTRSVERFDPRVGCWQPVASLHLPRGYTAGCLTFQGYFVVSGGLHDQKIQGGLEGYDFRADRWFVVGSLPPRYSSQALVGYPPLEHWADMPASCLPIDVPDATSCEFLRAAHQMALMY